MSDPTYRIDVIHRPSESPFPWVARIYRLSDDAVVKAIVNVSRESVIDEARKWVRAENTVTVEPHSLYVGDDGKDAAPHSVKA